MIQLCITIILATWCNVALVGAYVLDPADFPEGIPSDAHCVVMNGSTRDLTTQAPLLEPESCPIDMFQCEQSGECIPYDLLCNYELDCLDTSDELGCPLECPGDSFHCADHSDCISRDLQCDGSADCDDESDEENCEDSTEDWSYECYEPYYVQCPSGYGCMPANSGCDGYPDCHDESDEENCQDSTEDWSYECYEPYYVQCPSGYGCMPVNSGCDGYPDCHDESDEENCQACFGDSFHCSGENRCIANELRCDGNSDCGDGADEESCQDIDTFWRYFANLLSGGNIQRPRRPDRRESRSREKRQLSHHRTRATRQAAPPAVQPANVCPTNVRIATAGLRTEMKDASNVTWNIFNGEKYPIVTCDPKPIPGCKWCKKCGAVKRLYELMAYTTVPVDPKEKFDGNVIHCEAKRPFWFNSYCECIQFRKPNFVAKVQ